MKFYEKPVAEYVKFCTREAITTGQDYESGTGAGPGTSGNTDTSSVSVAVFKL